MPNVDHVPRLVSALLTLSFHGLKTLGELYVVFVEFLSSQEVVALHVYLFVVQCKM